MSRQEELLESFRIHPEQAAEDFLESEARREQLGQELAQARIDLQEAKAFIAELTRQLFGPKADKLSPEQEEQLKEAAGDAQEQAERPPPVSRQCLEEELEDQDPQRKGVLSIVKSVLT
jgi:hypothetical protein